MKKPTLPKLKAKLQKVFNKYIRLRDSWDGYFTCISCGMTKSTDTMNAGHFYACKGYDALRFNEDNVHGECAACNCFDESHLIGYAKNLEKKIGKEGVEELEYLAKDYKMNGWKWQRSELEDMIEYYTEKIKEL